MKKSRKPTHPGEVFYYDVLEPLGISITNASKHLRVSRKTVSELVSGKISLSPLLAIRIAMVTNTTFSKKYPKPEIFLLTPKYILIEENNL